MTNIRRRRYPSDLTEEQWSRLEEILPPTRAVGRRRTIDLRAVANAINYRWETGCVWRMLPHDFPCWATVYSYFRSWHRTGIIRQMRQILLEPRPRPMFRPHLHDRRDALFPEAHRHPADGLPVAPAPGDAGFSSPHDRRGAFSPTDPVTYGSRTR